PQRLRGDSRGHPAQESAALAVGVSEPAPAAVVYGGYLRRPDAHPRHRVRRAGRIRRSGSPAQDDARYEQEVTVDHGRSYWKPAVGAGAVFVCSTAVAVLAVSWGVSSGAGRFLAYVVAGLATAIALWTLLVVTGRSSRCDEIRSRGPDCRMRCASRAS